MENRRSPRVPVSFHIWYRLEGGREDRAMIGAEERRAMIVNISAGGLAILSDTLIPEETKLDLKFHLTTPEKKSTPLSAIGQVCYNFLLEDRVHYHTGVEFIM